MVDIDIAAEDRSRSFHESASTINQEKDKQELVQTPHLPSKAVLNVGKKTMVGMVIISLRSYNKVKIR